MKISEALKKAVDNLPAKQKEEMTKFINRANQQDEDYVQMKETLSTNIETLGDLRKQKDTFDKAENKLKEAEQMERQLQREKDDLEKQLDKVRLEEAQKRNDELFKLVSLLVGGKTIEEIQPKPKED